MAIDQSKLGQHIQEQMAAIEQDSDVPDDAEIGGIITIVEVLGPEDEEGQRVRNMRVRTNVPPHVAIGLLEESKAIQLSMLL
ncbi:MAG: hypothetical protein QOI84_845 [Solirubrobacterales bacterium]|nr:hypothetical protein [Solirubrobacterales bacterium]